MRTYETESVDGGVHVGRVRRVRAPSLTSTRQAHAVQRLRWPLFLIYHNFDVSSRGLYLSHVISQQTIAKSSTITEEKFGSVWEELGE